MSDERLRAALAEELYGLGKDGETLVRIEEAVAAINDRWNIETRHAATPAKAEGLRAALDAAIDAAMATISDYEGYPDTDAAWSAFLAASLPRCGTIASGSVTPRTEAGRLFVADDPAALPGVVAIEAEKEAATRKELAAKVAPMRPLSEAASPDWQLAERGIARMVRERPQGPQIANFILDEDAVFAVAAVNLIRAILEPEP